MLDAAFSAEGRRLCSESESQRGNKVGGASPLLQASTHLEFIRGDPFITFAPRREGGLKKWPIFANDSTDRLG